MFAEEEWTESWPAEEQSQVGVRTEALNGNAECSQRSIKKSKAISKRCLKRTLQTLGSLPQWESIRPNGSDEEMEEAPVLANKKKKKCKKRKKNPDARDEEEKHGKGDIPEAPVKKRRIKQKLKEPNKKSVKCESEGDANKLQMSSTNTEDNSEKKLSRQQWRNKIKNKKRCKNKFLQNTTEVRKVNLKEEKLEQTQAHSQEEKTLIDNVSTCIDIPKNKKDKKMKKKKSKNKGKESSDTNHSSPIADESVCNWPKADNNAIQKPTDAHEKCEKLKPVRIDKRSQMQTKKLHHILKSSVTDSSKTSVEEKPETVNTSKKESENVPDRSSALRSRMEKRLESARFRYINELLYTSSSGEAKRMFKQDPDAIGIYHQGYTEQVKRWPANPVDSIISYIQQKPASLVVADFGCGDCKIARSVKNKVHCFDLAPVCDLVTVCDMSNVPLADRSVDIAVFCLSLMGTNLGDFLAEANRVLVVGGVMKIAEVVSRFEDIRQFIASLARLGFKLVSKDTNNTHFYSFEFTKTRNAPDNVKKIGLQLKPCLYKKR